MNHFPDSGDDQFDPTVDRLLQQAFAGRPADSTGRASLIDVRARARRHQRRRAGAVVGAAAVVGIGGVGVLSQRDDGAITASPGDDSATSTTAAFPICWSPQQEYPTTTMLVDATWPADVSTTTMLPSSTVAESTEVQPTSTTVEWPTTTVDPSATTTLPDFPGATFLPNTTLPEPVLLPGSSLPPECVPNGQYRCSGGVGTDELGYEYFTYCEPVTNNWYMYPPTTVVGSFVVIVDASGVPGASDDLFNLLSTSGFGAIQVIAATRTVEQTMLMPIGELQAGGWEILQQLTGIDGSDTWTPDLIDGELPMGAGVVVVIGEDYWDRMTVPVSTLPPTTSTLPATTTSSP